MKVDDLGRITPGSVHLIQLVKPANKIGVVDDQSRDNSIRNTSGMTTGIRRANQKLFDRRRGAEASSAFHQTKGHTQQSSNRKRSSRWEIVKQHMI